MGQASPPLDPAIEVTRDNVKPRVSGGHPAHHPTEGTKQMKRLTMICCVLGLPLLSGCAEMQADMRAHPYQYMALSQGIHEATVEYSNSIDRPPNPACHQGNIMYC